MRVLEISTVCGSGSVGRITVDIYHILEDLGDECLIAYGRRTAPADVNAWRFGSNLDMGIHVLSTFFRGEHGFASTAQTKRLIDKIREWDPDIIHLHNIHGFVLQVELLFQYLRTCGKPVVWTLHDCWSYTGHCAVYDDIECIGWKSGCTGCKEYRRTYPYALFCNNAEQNFVRKKAAFSGLPNLTIVAVSDWLAGQVQQSFLREYPIRVIPNGVDRSVFHPYQDADTEALRNRLGLIDRFVALGVANVWTRWRGLEYLEQLAPELPKEMVMVLIGLDRKQIAHLPKGMIGLPRTDTVQELATYYSMADVYINPTLGDTFSMTNVEAMACGTPVITFATGGAVESLTESTGHIVSRRDVEGLREALLEEQQNPLSSEDCVARATKYDKRKCFMQYVALYHELLDARQ